MIICQARTDNLLNILNDFYHIKMCVCACAQPCSFDVVKMNSKLTALLESIPFRSDAALHNFALNSFLFALCLVFSSRAGCEKCVAKIVNE